MSVHLIYLKDGAKIMRPVLTREEYLALRNSQQNRQADKRHMVQMNYSCLPNDDGTLKGSKRMSNTVGMDIDLNEKENEIEKLTREVRSHILSKKKELGLLMLEESATKGYHIVFRRHEDMTQEENLKWASKLLGVEYDKGAKDITRVFYTPADKLVFLLDDIFPLKECTEGGYGIMSPVPGSGKDPGPKDSAHALSCNMSSLQDSECTKESPCADKCTREPSPSAPEAYPYKKIVEKWWQMYNDGKEPVKSNRNTLTFELAVNLRHICGFDREVMDRVIPCYDGFPQQEKMACIDSALAEKRTQMPRRLKEVLFQVQRDELKEDVQSPSATDLEEAILQDDLYHYDRLPRLPLGVRDSVDATGHQLAMPTLIAIAPAIGALATGVKLDVHGKARGLNICSFVVGEFASGKGQMDDVIAAWMAELQAETDIYTQQEEEWAAKTKRMKSGKTPEQPKLPVRMLTLNNTVANIAERLANTEGKHSFSFTPEADNVALKWKQSVSDFSVMLRQAYDEARYDREAKSADAVRVHIEKLLWNVTMCGTQDALYRVITNYTDGLLSRLAIARTPDNTFSPLADDPAQLTDTQSEHIGQVAHLLPLMRGSVVLPKLEARGRQWLETIRMEAMKNDDRVLARQRMRGCVNAQRITTALWLPKVAETLIKKYGLNGAEWHLKRDPGMWVEMLRRQQTEDMLLLFDLVADYLLDNDLYYFRDRIESAYESSQYKGNANAVRSRKGKNDSIFERLAAEFTFEQSLQQSIAVKGTGATRNSVHQMLKNWRKQGLITQSPDSHYHKIVNCQLS